LYTPSHQAVRPEEFGAVRFEPVSRGRNPGLSRAAPSGPQSSKSVSSPVISDRSCWQVGFFSRFFFMRRTDLAHRTEPKSTSTGLGRLANDLPNSHLPAAPFKAWSPPGMKTGLRNQLIGRKISLVPFRALEIDQRGSQPGIVSETVTVPSKR
jgi:hypothetical protein